jgi:hypothetical protein
LHTAFFRKTQMVHSTCGNCKRKSCPTGPHINCNRCDSKIKHLSKAFKCRSKGHCEICHNALMKQEEEKKRINNNIKQLVSANRANIKMYIILLAIMKKEYNHILPNELIENIMIFIKPCIEHFYYVNNTQRSVTIPSRLMFYFINPNLHHLIPILDTCILCNGYNNKCCAQRTINIWHVTYAY